MYMNTKATIAGIGLAVCFLVGAVVVVIDNPPSKSPASENAQLNASNSEYGDKNNAGTTRVSSEEISHKTHLPFTTEKNASESAGDPEKTNRTPNEITADTDMTAEEVYTNENLSVAADPIDSETDNPKQSDNDDSLNELIALQETYYMENVKYANSNNEQPSPDNADMPPKEAYKEQIDQQTIIEQAQTEGYVVASPAPLTTEPTKENTAVAAKGEYAYEIDQQRILDDANIAGNVIADPDSNAPKEDNISASPGGAYSDQIGEPIVTTERPNQN